MPAGLLRQATYTTARLDEGVLALWKGPGPTGLRVMAWNTGMHASYHQSVEYFPGKKSITKSVLFLKFEAMLELVIRLHIDLLQN
ncbi:hypothetical protein L1987_29342 [Smallanthus sonchifolius]|uniref:Uncharacterized protein n=1 Tax=Smallanthus sonchifolius TaxID=185202 RepID=A0ACB9I0I9_9ASTR|nr:hypothetical protein L1987_29342 [Smallanthus sonchifolius]